MQNLEDKIERPDMNHVPKKIEFKFFNLFRGTKIVSKRAMKG